MSLHSSTRPSLAGAAQRPVASWISPLGAFRRTAATGEVLGIAALRKDLGAEALALPTAIDIL